MIYSSTYQQSFPSSASGGYRYFFNGQECDGEVYGEGGFQNYGFRMYDTRIARFWGVDPLAKDYPMLTPFQFASNTPLWAIDLDGQEPLYHQLIDIIKRKATAIVIKKSQEVFTALINSIVNQFDNKVEEKKEQFVGSYDVNIYPNEDNKSATIVITNTTSMKSFLYRLAPEYSREEFRLGGNIKQTFIFTRDIPNEKE